MKHLLKFKRLLQATLVLSIMAVSVDGLAQNSCASIFQKAVPSTQMSESIVAANDAVVEYINDEMPELRNEYVFFSVSMLDQNFGVVYLWGPKSSYVHPLGIYFERGAKPYIYADLQEGSFVGVIDAATQFSDGFSDDKIRRNSNSKKNTKEQSLKDILESKSFYSLRTMK